MPVGDVAGYLGQADDLAIRVANHIKGRQGPEPRAILAYTPAFILRATGFQRPAQQYLRQPGGPVFGGEEHGKMLADHFVCAVPLDALCAGVPTDDFAIEVKHVDRVVNHRLHKLGVTAFMQGIQVRRVVLIHGCPN
ncbi:hypothetical protein D3C85_997300 [compost metagenome]